MKAGINEKTPLIQDYFNVIYESFCDNFYGGCEPEFSSEESFKQFEEFLNYKNYRYIREPYRDKTTPFLIFVKDYQWLKYKRDEINKRKQYEHTKKY